jgi:hypothetical protein
MAPEESGPRTACDRAESPRHHNEAIRIVEEGVNEKSERACRVLRQSVATWTQLDRRWDLSESDKKNELNVVRAELKKYS